MTIRYMFAVLLDAVDHFAFDVEHYGEEPPTWWWKQGARYDMYRETVSEGIGDEVEKRAAFFLVLVDRVRAFVTTTIVCIVRGHAEYDPESGCCERCGEYIAGRAL